MKVSLIASTMVDWSNIPDNGWEPEMYTSDADDLAEFAGRACYQSWSKPNPATRAAKDYHANTLAQRHFSIYEHASLTFYVEGVSRSLTHELIRHRHLSFSQLSQRFVDETNATYVVPPAIQGDGLAEEALQNAWDAAQFSYQILVERLTAKGLKRKQAREAARAVLPNMTETKIVVTGNVRAWREFVEKRNSPHADAEIRELAQQILEYLDSEAPLSVQDMQQEAIDNA